MFGNCMSWREANDTATSWGILVGGFIWSLISMLNSLERGLGTPTRSSQYHTVTYAPNEVGGMTQNIRWSCSWKGRQSMFCYNAYEACRKVRGVTPSCRKWLSARWNYIFWAIKNLLAWPTEHLKASKILKANQKPYTLLFRSIFDVLLFHDRLAWGRLLKLSFICDRLIRYKQGSSVFEALGGAQMDFLRELVQRVLRWINSQVCPRPRGIRKWEAWYSTWASL